MFNIHVEEWKTVRLTKDCWVKLLTSMITFFGQLQNKYCTIGILTPSCQNDDDDDGINTRPLLKWLAVVEAV